MDESSDDVALPAVRELAEHADVSIPSALLASLTLLSGLALLLPLLPARNRAARLVMATLVAIFNLRYAAWRYADTLPRIDLSFASIFSWVYFTLELTAVVCATWHILLLALPSDRTEEADQAEAALRKKPSVPSVDVFIATYNESRQVLERTIQAACQLDYPRVVVWVLDDGARPDIAALAEAHGVRYLARTTRTGFKAGNLNHGLAHSDGDIILCLDADFAVKPHFLYRTVGLLDDPEVALVQTPQHFDNVDAIQANLRGGQAWPEEQAVFFSVMQPARDTFDNAFCHGTSFVVKRACLNTIGGFPEESIVEDLYTTYSLKEHGFVTRYLNEPLSSGLAADRLSEFIKQRVRWAVGTMQCLRLPNGPIRARKLSLLDRLFLLDPILFYVSYLYVALTLCAPAIYWWTGASVFHSKLGHLLNMVAPRMGASMLVLYWISGRRVVPVVSEIGRAVAIFHLAGAIVRGLFIPRSATFEVTRKDARTDTPQVQWSILRGFLGLSAATLAGMVINGSGLHHPTAWSDDVGMNVALTSFVLWTLFLCCLSCVDQPRDVVEGSRGVQHGSVVASAFAVARRMFAP